MRVRLLEDKVYLCTSKRIYNGKPSVTSYVYFYEYGTYYAHHYCKSILEDEYTFRYREDWVSDFLEDRENWNIQELDSYDEVTAYMNKRKLAVKLCL